MKQFLILMIISYEIILIICPFTFSPSTIPKSMQRLDSKKGIQSLELPEEDLAKSTPEIIEDPQKKPTSHERVSVSSRKIDYKSFIPRLEPKLSRKLSIRIQKFESDKIEEIETPPTGSLTPYKYFVPNPPFKLPYFGCKAIGTWNIFRHGTRMPGGELITWMQGKLKDMWKAIIRQYDQLVSELQTESEDISTSKSDPNKTKIKFEDSKPKIDKLKAEKASCYSKKLRNWKLTEGLIKQTVKTLMKPKKSKEKRKKNKPGEELEEEGATKGLSDIGRYEMSDFGIRFEERFSDLLPSKLDPKEILVKFTDCERTQTSALRFLNEVFESIPEDESWHEPIIEGKDPLLKFDATCPHWKSFYKVSYKQHVMNFKNGREIEEVTKNFQEKCFPNREIIITEYDMINLNETCAFELAWGVDSPWCELITVEVQKVFEYLEDMELFLNDGPENRMNEEIGCTMMQDLVKRLIGKVYKENGEIKIDRNSKDIRKFTFYFSHLTTILKFITHLGLYKDDKKLNECNYKDMENRKWKSSYIGPFATNLTFVLMECESYDEDDRLYILVLHQERPVHLPGCPEDTDLCPLKDFIKAYEDSIFACRYDVLCKKRKNFKYPDDPENLKKPKGKFYCTKSGKNLSEESSLDSMIQKDIDKKFN